MKRICLISTGGTISQVLNEEGISSLTDEKSAKELGKYIEDLKNKNIDIEINPVNLINKDSSNIIVEDWQEIIKTIVDEYDNYDACIITHGTNTLGYTATALSFALTNIGKPIILTGSQIAFGELGSDANLNLENAIRLIMNKRYNLAGVMTIIGRDVISGVRTQKLTEFEYNGFRTAGDTRNIAYIGREIKIDEIVLNKHLSYLRPFATNKSELKIDSNFNMNIISLSEFPSMDNKIFEMFVDKNIGGIILNSFGSGDPNVAKQEDTYRNLRNSFELLRENKIPVIVTTQAPDGISSMAVNEPRRSCS